MLQRSSPFSPMSRTSFIVARPLCRHRQPPRPPRAILEQFRPATRRGFSLPRPRQLRLKVLDAAVEFNAFVLWIPHGSFQA